MPTDVGGGNPVSGAVRLLSGMTAISVYFAVSAMGAPAQRIEVGAAVVSQSLDWPRAPISFVAVGPRDETLVVGGPTRQDLFLLDSGARAIGESVSLADLGTPLAWPITGAFDGADRVLLVDAQSPRWVRLSRTAAGWHVTSVQPTELSGVSSLCAMSGRRFVMGIRGSADGGPIVHEVDGNGAVSRSFGRQFGEIVNPASSYGRLLCLPSSDMLIAAASMHSEVRGYSSAGGELWTASLPSFRHMRFEADGRLVRFVLPPDSVWDQIVSMFSPARNVIAVQVGRVRGRNGAPPYRLIHTFFLDAASGRVLGTQKDLPLVLAATRTHLYATDPTEAAALLALPFTYRSR